MKDTSDGGSFRPVCTIGKGVAIGKVEHFVGLTFSRCKGRVSRALPRGCLLRCELLSEQSTVESLRFPTGSRRLGRKEQQFICRRFFCFRLGVRTLEGVRERRSGKVTRTCSLSELVRFVSSLPFTLAGTRGEIIGRVLASVGSPCQVGELLRKSINSNGATITTVTLFTDEATSFRKTLVIPARVLTRRRTRSLGAVLRPFNLQYRLLADSIGKGHEERVLRRLGSKRVSILVNARTLVRRRIRFGGLKLIVASRRREFNIKRQHVLERGNRDPSILFVATAPVPEALTVAIFKRVSISVVSRVPTKQGTVRAC